MARREVTTEPVRLSSPAFRALLDTVPDAMLIVARDGRIRLANRQAEQLFGYPSEELVGEPVEKLVPDHLAEVHAGHRAGFFESPSVRPMGARTGLEARHRDDSRFPVEINLSPLETDEGTCAATSIRDITDRRRIEELHRWQADFSSGVIDSLPGIFYLIDQSGLMRKWNSNMEAMTGYRGEEIARMTPHDFVSETDRPKVEKAFREVFDLGQSSFDAPLRAKDGSTRDYHFIGHRITLGEEEFLTGLGIDITAVRKTESALEYVSGLQRLLVDASKGFIASGATHLDELITDILGRVGAYCDVDRSYLFRFKQERALMDNTHEWCAPGVTPEIDNLQDLPREAVPKVVELMERRRVMHVPRVADLGPDWANDRAVFEEEDIQSLIVVPIVVSEELHGFIGFDSVRRERTWEDEEIRLLQVLADLIGAVIQRETAAGALRDSEALRSHAEKLAHLGSWEWHIGRDEFRASKEWQRVTGCYAEPLTREAVLGLAHPDDLPATREKLQRTLETGEPYDIEHRIYRPDTGELRWIKAHAELDGEPEKAEKLHGFAQDITERKRIEAVVAESEVRYRSVVENIREVVFQADEQGRWTFLNPAWEEITGYPVYKSLGRPFHGFVYPEDRPGSDREYQALMRGNKRVSRSEVRYVTASGDFRWLEVNLRVTTDGHGRPVGCAGTMRDVTEQREAERKMLQLAHYDPVTDLPNRILALDRLEQLLKNSTRSGGQVAVLFLDLDHFKKANDTLGHEAGDQLLKEAAQRLLTGVRDQDTVARFGGDEFLILLGGLGHAADAQPVTEKLLESFRDPFHLQGRELMLTASVGIAVAPTDGNTAQDLLRNADMAMYESKVEGRNTYHYFTAAMNREVERRLAIEEQLRGALGRRELSLVFQPLVDLSDGTTVGAEALIRWHNPALGEVPPEEFIPIAEQTGLIDTIGQFVLEQALQEAVRWRQDYPDFRVSVNVSPQQFRDQKLVSRVEGTLRRAGLPGRALQVEITESVLLSGRSQASDALNKLKHLGVGIAMDDFGTGYASLSYLRHFPFDTLKIDRSFIGDISEDPRDCDLVVASLALAHSMGLSVVAEGVETDAQLALLRKHGCQLAQGFLFGRPMDAQAFTESIATATDTRPT
jgi:diguanylate cyclase (GGDEF)-like protein/PAS domain S-box-containing protein